MISNLILVFVVATLVVIVVAMLRQRGNAAAVREADPRHDVWLGAAMSKPQPVVVPPLRPARDHDALARDVMAYLRILEQRGAPGLLEQVIPVFLKDTSTRLDALRSATARKDGTESYRLAHTIHGSAASVGATTMVATCADLIREVRCGAFDRCDDLIGDLARDYEAISRAAEADGSSWRR